MYQKGLGREWKLQTLRGKGREWRVARREFGSERRKGKTWKCAIGWRVEEEMLGAVMPSLRITQG